MDTASLRNIVLVASLQAAVAITALASSLTAAIAAAVVGAVAVGRYIAVACFAATLGKDARAVLRVLTASAWILGLFALAAAIAAVALKARPALPWAVAAALTGPFGMSALALGEGLGALFSAREGHSGGRP
jgi:hypothetical protein